MSPEDLDFSFEFISWCSVNGVSDKEQMKKLLIIMERHFAGKGKQQNSSTEEDPGYPDYRAIRKGRNLLMEKVASDIGISKQRLHYIERRITKRPNPEILGKLNLYYEL